ncbi:MAG: 30S ribosomal protein S15 [Bryobacterales bacterium]|nr:30S ribosomal protein S15 [Bryobacterales bacterium]
MPLTTTAKQEIYDAYGAHDADVGSTEVQVAMLSRRIAELTEHLKEHRKDFSSRRGMFKAVSRRRRLLRYLRGRDPQGYQNLIQALGLRG